jgi:signal transduction histidine kinase
VWAAGKPSTYGSLSRHANIERDASVGHLYLARRPGRESFDEQDERITRLLSAFIATALTNVKLNRQARTAFQQREEMISVISHDLRSPLYAIVLSADRIRSLCASADYVEELRNGAERVARTAQRMSRLIDNLVDLTLVESHALRIKRAPQAVAPMVAEAIDLLVPLARDKSIDLRSAVEPMAPVACESDLIVRVLWNLVSNAIKFTEPGGTILVNVRRDGSAIYFSVEDTGIGISEEQQAHLFERFWQADVNHRGAGLGLYISKGIVEAHSGRIGATSQRGVGTTIWFTLPAEPALPAQPHA